MRIAYVYDNIYPYYIGGAEKRIWELARRLAQKGHEVTLLGMKYWEGKNIIYKEGVKLWGVCPPKPLFVNGRRSIKEAIYFAWKVLFPLLMERFDVIDCQEFPYFPSFSAKLCSVIRRTPLIITWLEVWDNYWFEYLGTKGIFGKMTERLASKLPKTIISISEKVKEDLIATGLDVNTIKVIPDGVDFARIQQIKPLGNKICDVLYAGRLAEHKNVDLLIKGIDVVKRKVPDIKCKIIGDGPEREDLQRLRTELHLEQNVEFLGFLEKEEDVISYMKLAKIFVLPSTREGAGLVTLEANACGLPVITIDHKGNGATEVVINGENGFLSELSAEDLATNIMVALDKCDYMRDNCIEFARRYDWDRMAELTESIYKEVCKPAK